MYKGTNPSALRSQKWISEALLSLMENKEFNSITIKEITDNCDLSRQTFYKVFNSKGEVIEYHLDKLFSEFLDQMHAPEIHSVHQISELYFLFYSKNSTFIKTLFRNSLSPILTKRFEHYLPLVWGIASGQTNCGMEVYKEAFISAGLVGILERYSREKDANTSEISNMLENLLNCEF